MSQRRPVQKLTDADGAWCAVQWCCGRLQRDIAAELGYKGPSAACTAISRFLRKYSSQNLHEHGPDGWITGDVRKRLVSVAVAEYVRQGGQRPRIRLVASTS